MISAKNEQKYMIEVNDLTKRLRKSYILKNISFRVPVGSVCAFVGHNGAGKTTTIRTILGLYRCNQGQVRIKGVDVKKVVNVHEWIGYIPEKENFSKIKSKRFLLNMASFYNIDKNDIQKKIIEYANIFDFVPNLNRKLTSLSSGQKKKVLIMQAFIHEPKLIIADEPTENLDPDTREIFYRLVKRAQKNGQTVFISTHNLDEIRNHIDYVVIIAKGRIRYSRAIHKGIDLHRIYNRFKPKVQI